MKKKLKKLLEQYNIRFYLSYIIYDYKQYTFKPNEVILECKEYGFDFYDDGMLREEVVVHRLDKDEDIDTELVKIGEDILTHDKHTIAYNLEEILSGRFYLINMWRKRELLITHATIDIETKEILVKEIRKNKDINNESDS